MQKSLGSRPLARTRGGISVAADVPSGRKPLPSSSNSASNFPDPQLVSTFCTVATSVPSKSATGCRFGAITTIAPMLRSRLAQPSCLLPMPGAKESSTVE
jgi:hypothetical protein